METAVPGSSAFPAARRNTSGTTTPILSENELMRWFLEKYKTESVSAPAEDVTGFLDILTVE